MPGAAIEVSGFGKELREICHASDEPLDWAIGLADFAAAIRESRLPLASASQASHLVEVFDAIRNSASGGHRVAIDSSFPPPKPRTPDESSPVTLSNISYMGANFVAQQCNWNMSDWSEGDQASNVYYEPIGTFPERFRQVTQLVAAQGFNRLDVWTGQINWQWATDEHLKIAVRILEEAPLTVPTYAGNFGSTPDDFERACTIAKGLGAKILAGSTSVLETDRRSLVASLRNHNLAFALENHPNEYTPDDVLTQLGTGDEDVLGTAIDTGWWGTNGFPADAAITKLYDRVIAVHLKDVKAVGGHDTCTLGEGIVPIRRCVELLAGRDYDGPVCIEHEPYDHDPMDEVLESRARVQAWVSGK